MDMIAWKLATKSKPLWTNILKSKYFLDFSFLEVENPRFGSVLWNDLQNTRVFLKNHKIWIIGDHRKVDFWKERWLLLEPLKDHEALSRVNEF